MHGFGIQVFYIHSAEIWLKSMFNAYLGKAWFLKSGQSLPAKEVLACYMDHRNVTVSRASSKKEDGYQMLHHL